MRTIATFINGLLLFSDKTTTNTKDGTRVSRKAANRNTHEYDPILDWKPPSNDEIKQIQQTIIQPMKSLTSAVFFCTDQQGQRHEGLKQMLQKNTAESSDDKSSKKKQKPILFVSNHQLAGFDSYMVVSEIIDQCNLFVRPMTHPFLSMNDDTTISLPGSIMLESIGALPVSPKTYYKLMETNQQVLLYPGGAKESFHKANEEYTMLAWNDKIDFVRIAAKFNATIVPFSSVGAAESAFFLDQLPFAESFSQALIDITGNGAPYNARYDGGETISFPLIFPKPLPARHYFLFHKPVDTTNVNYKNREECKATYIQIKQSIQQGCYDLLEARKMDPYNDPLRRVPYEQLSRKQAPTFPVKLLNSQRALIPEQNF